MNELLLLILAFIVALQVALHLRLARLPERAADQVRRETHASANLAADALQAATRERLETVVAQLRAYQDELTASRRAEVENVGQRAKHAELVVSGAARAADRLHELVEDAGLLRQIRVAFKQSHEFTSGALGAILRMDEAAKTSADQSVAEARATPAHAPMVEAAASEGEPEEQRKTVETRRSCLPGEGPSMSPAAGESEGGSDDEATHVFEVDAKSVREAVGRSALHAVPPPPPDDDAHAGILPPAPLPLAPSASASGWRS